MLVVLLISGQNSWFIEAVSQSRQLTDLMNTYDTSSPILTVLTLSFYLIVLRC